MREDFANDVAIKAVDLDRIGGLFVDCVHSQRKSLRQKLVKIKLSDKFEQQDDSSRNIPNSLLKTYLKIVKTGAPHEIEEFSQIER